MLENQEPVIHPTNNVTAAQNQRKTVNLHPYRTNTQHYPSIIQGPDLNHTGSSTSSAHIDEVIAPAHAVQPENNNADNLQEPLDGQLPSQGLEHYLQEQEKQLIITALKQTGWNKTQAAELLGTTFRSLRYRMKKLEIEEDQSK
ncbi:MAG: hypothetical protein L0G63_12995 [Psychrobacter sp.]|nr:hypothetical protein [Psychrobacter sp.]